MTQLDAKYHNIAEMDQKLKDVDVYLTVGLNLIGQNTTPFYASNSSKIDSLINFNYECKWNFGIQTIFGSLFNI